MPVELFDHQKEALHNLENGNVLCGATGSGKSVTALAYYMEKEKGKDIYVITTAKKRNKLDWDGEAALFGISRHRDSTSAGVLVVDSWNNIGNYVDVKGAFFIFDEQRVVGSGTWVKSFIRIAKQNAWILLSATPGDTWMDYAPLFVANRWFDNLTQFKREHVVYAPFVKFPKIVRFDNVSKLEKYRHKILVEMNYVPHTIPIHNWLQTGYDREKWNVAVKERWNPYTNEPIRDVAELFRVMRRIVNEDPSRLEEIRALLKVHPKLIVFYNFDYELEILRTLSDQTTVAEYNGHRKHEIPDTDQWVYLVQYQAGSEGWNCIETDATLFYSLTYSYKMHQQAQGRTNRLNTPFIKLYYYFLASAAPIDSAIRRSLREKRNFNERKTAKIVENW